MSTRHIAMAAFIYLNFRRISDFARSSAGFELQEIAHKPSLYSPGEDYPLERVRYEVLAKNAFEALTTQNPPYDLLELLEQGHNAANRFVFIQLSFYGHGLSEAATQLQQRKPIKSAPYLHGQWRGIKIEVPVSPQDFFGHSYAFHFKGRPLTDIVGIVTSHENERIIIAPLSISFSVIQHELTEIFEKTIVIPIQNPYTGAKEVEKVLRQAEQIVKLTDAYTDDYTMDRLHVVPKSVAIKLITSYPKTNSKRDLARFDRFRREMKLFVQEHPAFECRYFLPLHVRLLLVDERAWLIDSSIKEAGKALTVMEQISDTNKIFARFDEMWKQAEVIENG